MSRPGFVLLLFAALLSLALPIQSSVPANALSRFEEALWRTVRLRVVKRSYDPGRPWEAPRIRIFYASGLYLGNGRILSDLSIARNAVNITARFTEDPEDYTLQIRHIGYDCGLVLLDFELPKEKKKEKEKNTKKKNTVVVPAATDKTNKDDTKKGHDDSVPRKLDLKLLRKSDTDIPFVELEDTKPKINKEDTKEAAPKKRLEVIRLYPLPFSLMSLRAGHDLVFPTYDVRGRRDRLQARFLRQEFRALDGSDVDFHWVYRLDRTAQDFLESQNGAPALYQNRIVGILHVEDRGHAYVISASTIRAFLDDIHDGRYDGLKSTGLKYGLVRSPAERRSLGLKAGEGALRILRLAIKLSHLKHFERGDVLLGADGVRLDERGLLRIGNEDWNLEEYFRSRLRKKKEVRVEILRGARRLSLPLTPVRGAPKHPGRSLVQGAPAYFLGAGVAFVELNYDLMQLKKFKENANLQSFYKDYILTGFSEGRRPIVLLYRFSDPENEPARLFEGEALRMVNGRRVFGLQELAREWKRSRDSEVVLDFYERRDKLILPFYLSERINHRVSRRYLLQENARVR